MPISRKSVDEQQVSKPVRSQRNVLSLKSSSQLPSKRTLNLCKREKKDMPIEVFLIVLATLIIFIIIVEYFGVFRPYTHVEAMERELAAQQSALAEKNKTLNDPDTGFKATEEYYNQYNFEGFDQSIADRLDVLALLEREIMNKNGFDAKIRSLAINGRVVSLTVDGLNVAQVGDLEFSLESDDMVEDAFVLSTGFNNDGSPTAQLTITLKDATQVQGE